ncbi:MAG TPA: LytTR family DNA-binding domain-containing protein [Bacteroidales bacterium]|nr:LytTR family DNA-binding domain-containing protein [Bacteroidales bacterium]
MQSPNNSTMERLPLKTSDFIQYIDFVDIIWVKALKKQSQVCIKGKPEVITSTFSFGDLEDMLPTTFFFKCHRSTIINLSHLQRFYKGKRQLLLSDNQCVIIAEERIGEFENRINSSK